MARQFFFFGPLLKKFAHHCSRPTTHSGNVCLSHIIYYLHLGRYCDHHEGDVTRELIKYKYNKLPCFLSKII